MKIVFAPGFEESFKRCFSSNPYYAIPRMFRDIKFELENAWQRVLRGWDEPFFWSHYHVHSIQMVEMLDFFIGHHCGYPVNMTNIEWEGILGQMRDGFQAIIDLDDAPWSGPEHDSLQAIHENGIQLYAKHYQHLWD